MSQFLYVSNEGKFIKRGLGVQVAKNVSRKNVCNEKCDEICDKKWHVFQKTKEMIISID